MVKWQKGLHKSENINAITYKETYNNKNNKQNSLSMQQIVT